MTGPVFEIPTAPTGREYSSTHLIRIVDPLGEAIAWFAPGIGACCAGYAIRQVGGSSTSQNARWRDVITGSEIMRSFPPSTLGKNDDGNVASTWRFVERDPASCLMEWKVGKGSQTEHWLMVASLADAQLSLSLRIWNTGTTPIQTGVRLRLAFSSSFDIILRSGNPTANGDSADHRSNTNTQENQGNRITISVEATPHTSTVQTDYLKDESSCTITYHQPNSPVLIIRPGECQCFSVLIGPGVDSEDQFFSQYLPCVAPCSIQE